MQWSWLHGHGLAWHITAAIRGEPLAASPVSETNGLDGRTVLRFHPMYISHGFKDITGNKQEFRQSWQKLYKLDGTVPFDGT